MGAIITAGERAAREVVQFVVEIAQEDSGGISPAVKEPAAAAAPTATTATAAIRGVRGGAFDAL